MDMNFDRIYMDFISTRIDSVLNILSDLESRNEIPINKEGKFISNDA
jgi:hypothetical protein